jgi:hypothetical protein
MIHHPEELVLDRLYLRCVGEWHYTEQDRGLLLGVVAKLIGRLDGGSSGPSFTYCRCYLPNDAGVTKSALPQVTRL